MRDETKQLREQAVVLRLRGISFNQISHDLGLSRSYVSWLLRPPRHVRARVASRARNHCEACGRRCLVGVYKHRNSVTVVPSQYNDADNVVYVCPGCYPPL